MTDRVHALTVILREDIRDDDIEPLIQAIRQFRVVLEVTPHVTDVISESVARSRLLAEVEAKIWEALRTVR